MPLININADFRKVAAALVRIARALEVHLLYAYNYRTDAPSKRELAGEDAGADYSTDEDTMKREMEEVRREIEQSDEAGLVK